MQVLKQRLGRLSNRTELLRKYSFSEYELKTVGLQVLLRGAKHTTAAIKEAQVPRTFVTETASF